MRFRFAFLLFFAAICMASVNAQLYQITTHLIQINVNETGKAEITEKFFLSFPTDYHLQRFRSKSEKIGVDLSAWQQFNPTFRPSVGAGGDTMVSDIGFVENEGKYLEIKYSLNEPLMKRENETSRRKEFSLNPKFFNGFLEGSLWVIPSNVTIVVDLPLQAEVIQPVKPEANVSGNRIVWTGYKSTNVISLKYVLWKQIASLTLNEVVVAIAGSEAFPLVAAAIVLFTATLLWKRRSIASRIEAYIIEHSDLLQAEEEE